MTTVSRRVVNVDRYNWTEPIEGDPKARQRYTAVRGDVIEVSVKEAARGEGLGFLADPDAPVEDDGASEPGEWVSKDDETIAKMSVAEVVAYVGQAPADQQEDEIARVVELEHERSKPRAGVLALGDTE